ncbi:MAG: hypothetical protein PVSMB2_09790 [Ktedonobacteraceae bacterium]
MRAASSQSTSRTNTHPLCSKIGTTLWASTALRMWCNPPSPTGTSTPTVTPARTFGSNVNAANPAEDISPSGVRGYGQSETSIAAIGPYVVEAWNDVTAFVTTLCPAPLNKEEATGFAFSTNGGTSFVDQGGPPNANCTTHILAGDPSVEAWSSGGSSYFYISSLYFPIFSSSGSAPDTRAFVAINACNVRGTGVGAVLRCGQPVLAASSTECQLSQGGRSFCSFLDKPYLSIDPQHGRLYVSYTEFGIKPPPDPLAFGQIELAACDIGTPTGATGPIGGTADTPVCTPGGKGSPSRTGSPYFVVAPGATCANQGSYPAVDPATGDVYVAYEFNLQSDVFIPGCNAIPTQNVVKYLPFTCLTLLTASCRRPVASNAVNIVTMVATALPGYTRFPLQDFPRIAVSDKAGTVSIVWNDAGVHPLGDILLQSFALGSLTGIQSSPVRLNSHASGGLHFLPALRNATQNGNVNVSWYERSSPTTTLTTVSAALSVNPRTTRTPASNTLVTTIATDWLKVTEFPFFPNFGDYTDNYVMATSSAPSTNDTLYVAWADGRTGIPQPFEAHTTTH